MTGRIVTCLAAVALALAGCSEEGSDSADTGGSPADTTPDVRPDTNRGDTGAPSDTGQMDTDRRDTSETTGRRTAQLVHKFPDRTLSPGEEEVPCVQWTLHNDEPLYVNAVTLANEGGFHHSNWFVVPKSYAPGEDGYFDCDTPGRNFAEISAALQGTVLFAQSTQAQSETQKFPEGVTIKIPPNSKVMADVHFLNIAPREKKTSSRMTLDLIHPGDVETVVVPFRLSYLDLQIPPKTESRFTGECNFKRPYETKTGSDFDMKLYYVLPHYHGLGNYFSLEYMGGPKDGEKIFELTGFNAEANGQTFNPPLDVSHAKGFRFTCGYDNPRDEVVKWGIGSREMCVMLGFADSDSLIDASVGSGTKKTGTSNGIVNFEGPCNAIALGETDAHKPPTKEEKTGKMYVPETDAAGNDLDPIPECRDTPEDAQPTKAATLSNLSSHIFEVSCAFSACHGDGAAAGGLDLTANDLHAELMNHEVTTPTELPLVDPGNPQGSWLYRVTSTCEPEAGDITVSSMPRNSPTLLEPNVVAMIREWIAQGAKDN